jgi:hypothetical protein
MTSILYTLLGGALVVIGVLAAAVADRVRGLRITRERAVTAAPRELANRPAPIQVIEPEPKLERSRMPRAEAKTQMAADDVIAALIASGYKKAVAAEATWGCNAADRLTIESWTAAALRRAGKGTPS